MVNSKARREDNHEHNDPVEVVVAGAGLPLIVAWGTPTTTCPAGFDEQWGGLWTIDNTEAWEGVIACRRTLLHVFSGFVVVFDEATLEDQESISPRSNTAEKPTLDGEHGFVLQLEPVSLSARILNLDTNKNADQGGAIRNTANPGTKTSSEEPSRSVSAPTWKPASRATDASFFRFSPSSQAAAPNPGPATATPTPEPSAARSSPSPPVPTVPKSTPSPTNAVGTSPAKQLANFQRTL